MSDQDFFFDEDEQVSKPTTKSSAKPAGKSPSKSAAKPSPSAPAKGNQSRAPKGASAAQPATSSTGTFFEQQVSVSVAALLVVVGLLIGVIIGVLVAPGQTESSISTTSPTGSATAPELTSDQLQSGELPAGHPDISGTATGSAETTTN